MLEKSFYELVKKNLEEEFRKFGRCYFEITAEGRISNEVKGLLDDLSLYIIKVERFSPDMMGYIIRGFMDKPLNEILSKKKELVIVEVKPEIKIKYIYQTKQYGEIFKAKYALLIYTEPMPEEVRRFLKNRPEILFYSSGYRSIGTAQFDREMGKIKGNSWYKSSPFEEDVF